MCNDQFLATTRMRFLSLIFSGNCSEIPPNTFLNSSIGDIHET